MKKNYICLVFLLTASLLFMGQVGIQEAEHDFGKIKGNQEVSHVFAIENDSEGTLFAEGVEAG